MNTSSPVTKVGLVLLAIIVFFTFRIRMIQNDPSIIKEPSPPEDYPVLIINQTDRGLTSKWSCAVPGEPKGFTIKYYNKDGSEYTKGDMKLFMSFSFIGSTEASEMVWKEVTIPNDGKERFPLIDSMLMTFLDMKDFFNKDIDEVSFAVAPNLKAASNGNYTPIDAREMVKMAKLHLRDNVCSSQYKG